MLDGIELLPPHDGSRPTVGAAAAVVILTAFMVVLVTMVTIVMVTVMVGQVMFVVIGAVARRFGATAPRRVAVMRSRPMVAMLPHYA